MKKYNGDLRTQGKTAIRHVNLTFEDLVNAMDDIVDERDTEIVAVLDDYKKYCFEEKLIPDGKNWMRAIVAGTTLEDNLKYNLYYDQASRGFSDHGYIGLYKGKSIRAIGKLKKMVLAEMIDGNLKYETEWGSQVTEEELKTIREVIQQAEDDHGYDLKTIQHRYFFVEHFYEMDFRKATKNPIQKSKLFNLVDMLGCKTLPETEQIAKRLDGKTWEEFS